MFRLSFLAVAVLLGSPLSLLMAAVDWPQFRGLQADGQADWCEAPLRWTTTEGIRWSVEIPGVGGHRRCTGTAGFM